jgi:uncharacterized protein YuzE
MRVKYFSDTDTAHIEFTDNNVQETKEISENIYIDIDQDGNLVSMTIEHAKMNAMLSEFSLQEISSKVEKNLWVERRSLIDATSRRNSLRTSLPPLQS